MANKSDSKEFKRNINYSKLMSLLHSFRNQSTLIQLILLFGISTTKTSLELSKDGL